MILVDTSVWEDHFRKGNEELEKLLNDEDVVCHPFIIEELACGNLKNRKEIIILLQSLSTTETADNNELLLFIDNRKLMGKGLGLIDMHLLSSAILSKASLWTLDKNLKQEAAKLRVDYKYT